MAKNDNLTDFLTDVADAIRTKKGTTAKINPQDFSSEIMNLPSGEGEVVEEKDICFYDYDGTLLFSYTIAEAQALTELPTPPSHEGLVFDGWNWDYEDVIALDYPMDIGAMYNTDDGKTRLFLEVEDEVGVDITLRFEQTANDVIVDFGDGSPTETSTDTVALIPHHYAKGSYILQMWSSGGHLFQFTGENNATTILGNKADKAVETLRHIEFGENAHVNGYAFMNCINLTTISAPNDVSLGWSSTYDCCISLQWLNISKKMTYLYGGILSNCPELKGISLPSTNIILNGNSCRYSGFLKFRIPRTVGSINGSIFASSNIKEFICTFGWSLYSFFNGCKKLEKVVLHQDSILAQQTFSGCTSLREVQIPENTTSIPAQCFYDCYTLRKLSFPKGLTNIASSAFANSGIKKYDFSLCGQVPTLENTNGFTGINSYAKIIVPDTLYDEWIAATNWATYADYIVKSSEYAE